MPIWAIRPLFQSDVKPVSYSMATEELWKLIMEKLGYSSVCFKTLSKRYCFSCAKTLQLYTRGRKSKFSLALRSQPFNFLFPLSRLKESRDCLQSPVARLKYRAEFPSCAVFLAGRGWRNTRSCKRRSPRCSGRHSSLP